MLGVRESRNRIIRDLFHSRAELSEGRNIFPGAFRVSNPFETLPTSCSCFGNVIKDENLTSTFKTRQEPLGFQLDGSRVLMGMWPNFRFLPPTRSTLTHEIPDMERLQHGKWSRKLTLKLHRSFDILCLNMFRINTKAYSASTPWRILPRTKLLMF